MQGGTEVRTYDARNRIDTLTFPDNNGNQAWDYTPDGLPESITTYNDGGASSVVNSYLYNKRRLPVSETLQADTYAWTVGYGYTGNGHLASLTYPDSLTVDYAPNALGQPTQAGSYATNVTYYPNGAIAGFTYGNGIVHTLTRNARGLPERSRDADGSTSIHDDSYDYDANGNVLAISDGVAGNRGDRDMVYDDLDRLVQATSPMFGTASYTYDAVDNLTHLQVTGGSQPRNHDYCYDGANQLTNVMTGGCSGGTSVIGLGYDVQGNLANKNGVDYTFDYGNRLRAGGPETYRYDAYGRRVRSSSSAGLAYSLYSQSGQILFQRDERSSQRRQYIYLGGSLIAERSRPIGSSTETVTYQHTDALGSPVATTNSAKTVLQRSEYEPYGFLTNRPMQDGPGYTGHITDAATGLVYMQQRYYDPGIPRFLSVDPVTAHSDPVRQFHRYRYAANNPYRYVDPDGRVDDDPRHRPGPAMPSPGPSQPPESEGDEIVDVEPVVVEAEKDPLPVSFTSDAKAFFLFYGYGSEQSIRPRRRFRSCIVTAECHYLGAGAYVGANAAGASLDGGNISNEDAYVGMTVDLGLVGGPGGDINFNGSGVGVGVGAGASLGGVLAAKVCFIRERSSGCE